MLALLLPPAVYISSIEALEYFFQKRYRKQIEAQYLGDTSLLFKGSRKIEDAIHENIDRYLRNRKTAKWLGLQPKITVRTHNGKVLYPLLGNDSKLDAANTLHDARKVAASNFAIMNQGLEVSVDLQIDDTSPLAIFILSLAMVGALTLLAFYYRSGLRRAEAEQTAQKRELQRLQDQGEQHRSLLDKLTNGKKLLEGELATLGHHLESIRSQADASEEELIEEIVDLESQIEQNQQLQKDQQDEIEHLKSRIRQTEAESRQKKKKRLRPMERDRKRFSALYKQVGLHERALEGFQELTEELKIKCEEVIHQLNDDPSKITVKRKVFGKKGRETVLEVVFAYKGRLYYRILADGRLEVLAIGNKNTQSRELAFLAGL